MSLTFAFRAKRSDRNEGYLACVQFPSRTIHQRGGQCTPIPLPKICRGEVRRRRYGSTRCFGHELNLVSQAQNARVINWALSSLKAPAYKNETTPVLRSTNARATATSQVFDGCALVTMTTSPDDMEDVPSEIGRQIVTLGQRIFRHVALIDAHNCLTGPIK